MAFNGSSALDACEAAWCQVFVPVGEYHCGWYALSNACTAVPVRVLPQAAHDPGMGGVSVIEWRGRGDREHTPLDTEQ